jgi:hypothetical protein
MKLIDEPRQKRKDYCKMRKVIMEIEINESDNIEFVGQRVHVSAVGMRSVSGQIIGIRSASPDDMGEDGMGEDNEALLKSMQFAIDRPKERLDDNKRVEGNIHARLEAVEIAIAAIKIRLDFGGKAFIKNKIM